MDAGKKVFIYALTCDKRKIDANKISKYFLKNNYEIVMNPNSADYIVFFTCGFVNNIAEECLNQIKRFQKYDAELIVAGCLPDISREKLKQIFKGKIITTKNLEEIDQIFSENKVKFKEIDNVFFPYPQQGPFIQSLNLIEKLSRRNKTLLKINRWLKLKILFKFPFFYNIIHLRKIEKKFYNIIISRGCIHNCTYCSIRKAIGPLKSKPLDQCISEFKSGLDKGYKRIILNADDIGTYGQDIKSSIAELLDEITKIKGDYDLLLHNTHPRWIIKYLKQFEDILKRKKIRSIVISIQSASDKVLKLMRRSYNREEVREMIIRLKNAYKDLEISAHFIVGFPQETVDDFNETFSFIKDIRFDSGSIFIYDDAEGAESNLMDSKVSEDERKRRMKIIFDYLKNNYDFVYDNGRAVTFFDKGSIWTDTSSDENVNNL